MAFKRQLVYMTWLLGRPIAVVGNTVNDNQEVRKEPAVVTTIGGQREFREQEHETYKQVEIDFYHKQLLQLSDEPLVAQRHEQEQENDKPVLLRQRQVQSLSRIQVLIANPSEGSRVVRNNQRSSSPVMIGANVRIVGRQDAGTVLTNMYILIQQGDSRRLFNVSPNYSNPSLPTYRIELEPPFIMGHTVWQFLAVQRNRNIIRSSPLAFDIISNAQDGGNGGGNNYGTTGTTATTTTATATTTTATATTTTATATTTTATATTTTATATTTTATPITTTATATTTRTTAITTTAATTTTAVATTTTKAPPRTDATGNLCPDRNVYPLTHGLQTQCQVDDPCSFNICLDLRSISGTVENWMSGFQWAQQRIERVLMGDNGPKFVFRNAGEKAAFYSVTEIPDFIDDVYITGEESVIDGPGKILGSAGPLWIKNVFNSKTQEWAKYTINGKMRFDTDDIQRYTANGKTQVLHEIILHEMLHVLGVGSLWRRWGLIDDAGNYTGVAATEAWQLLGCGPKGYVPVETNGGRGTAGSHWDEECMGHELMTGYISPQNRFSNITVGALADLKYEVNFSAADMYTINDIKKSNKCRQFCPGLPSSPSRRNLRTPPTARATRHRHPDQSSSKLSSSLMSRPPLSEKGLLLAIEFGRQMLEENMAHYDLHQRHLSQELEGGLERIEFVGGSHVEVFFVENDHIHEISVTPNLFEKEMGGS